MHIRRSQIPFFFLGLLFAVILTCPALPQVRKDVDEVKCPSGTSFRVLNAIAIAKPAPVYPEEARKKGITGSVAVFVVVDEQGRVSKARACVGPMELRGPAEDAAHKARLRPTVLSGVAVKVRGMLTYTFPQRGKGREAPVAAPDNPF